MSNLVTHVCVKCGYDCTCPALSTKFCVTCKVCKHTENLVAEAKVYQILSEPMSDEEAFQQMDEKDEDLPLQDIKYYRSEFCMGLGHSQCGDMSCTCVCHDSTYPSLGV